MDTLFTNAAIVTMDESMHIYQDGYLGVTDGKISYIAKKPPEQEKPKTIIDATGMVLIPGLINCHTHLPMILLRGYADDVPAEDRLKTRILPREAKLDARCVKAAALMGIAECLRFGVTSVSDMYNFSDAICEAVSESGIKANVGLAAICYNGENFDFDKDPCCREMVDLQEKWHGYDNGRILIDAAVQGEPTSCCELWESIGKYAAGNNLGVHVHLSENKEEHEECKERYGMTPAEIMNCYHLFDNGGIAAKCCWLEENDMKLLAKHKVSAVTCPISDAKLSDGSADLLTMIRNGMNVALGTDGADASGNADLFAEMKAAALTAKSVSGKPEAVNAAAMLMMATACGARAQKREHECGMLKVGMDADIAVLDFTQPHLIPCHNLLSDIVYSASGSDVCMTMVRGRILYAAGKYPTIDLPGLVKELGEYVMPQIFKDED